MKVKHKKDKDKHKDKEHKEKSGKEKSPHADVVLRSSLSFDSPQGEFLRSLLLNFVSLNCQSSDNLQSHDAVGFLTGTHSVCKTPVV